MFSKRKAVRKYMLALFIIVSLMIFYSVSYNDPKHIDQQDDHELDFNIAPVKLHVDEPGIF